VKVRTIRALVLSAAWHCAELVPPLLRPAGRQ